MYNIKLDKTNGKYVTIIDLNTDSFVGRDGKICNKIALTLSDDFGRIFHASNAWIRHRGVKPLFYNGHTINKSEALGQLLLFLNADSTFELIGKRIFVYPDKDNYLLPVCYDETLMLYFPTEPIIKTENSEKLQNTGV